MGYCDKLRVSYTEGVDWNHKSHIKPNLKGKESQTFFGQVPIEQFNNYGPI